MGDAGAGDNDSAGDVTGSRRSQHIPVARMLALLDGVVAIAMTILVLEIRLPPGLSGPALTDAVRGAGGKILYFLLSVAVIGMFWHGQQHIVSYAPSIDATLLWLSFAFLALLALIPFPTHALETYSGQTVGPALYGVTIGLTAVVELVMWRYVCRPGARTTAPVSARHRRLYTVQIAILAGAFLVSSPVAFVNPTAATLCWLIPVPLRVMVSRTLGRRR